MKPVELLIDQNNQRDEDKVFYVYIGQRSKDFDNALKSGVLTEKEQEIRELKMKKQDFWFRKDEWTVDDLFQLFIEYRTYGNQWLEMVPLFKDRKEWQIKNRFYTLARKGIRKVKKMVKIHLGERIHGFVIADMQTKVFVKMLNTVIQYKGSALKIPLLDLVQKYTFIDIFHPKYVPEKRELEIMREMMLYLADLNWVNKKKKEEIGSRNFIVCDVVPYQFKKRVQSFDQFKKVRREMFQDYSPIYQQKILNGEIVRREVSLRSVCDKKLIEPEVFLEKRSITEFERGTEQPASRKEHKIDSPKKAKHFSKIKKIEKPRPKKLKPGLFSFKHAPSKGIGVGITSFGKKPLSLILGKQYKRESIQTHQLILRNSKVNSE